MTAKSPVLCALALLIACSNESSAKNEDAATGSIADSGAGSVDSGASSGTKDAGAMDARVADVVDSSTTTFHDPSTPGVWTNVTPSDVNLEDMLGCGNYGTESMQADPMHPGELYTPFMCQGIWKSTDYGLSWKGPINTGAGGGSVGDCAGGLTVAPRPAGSAPTLYVACIRGGGLGFWSSDDGGVSWTRYDVAPGGDRQDFYPPVVDPYDSDHLLMAGHEMNVLAESHDAGHTWTSVSTDAGMQQNGGTAGIFFIDTGDAKTAAQTFLWIAQQSDQYGTWRTSDSGKSWQKVDKNEHPHGLSQIYQPDTKGTVYMAGAYSALGWGVLRSSDYGKTWMHVGSMGNEAIVFGTKKNVYAMNSGAVGLGGTLEPSLELSAQPGTGEWTMPGTPKEMTIGPAQAVVLHDDTHAIVVTANWGAGVWRYVEP
jgi:hypothetical protein